MTAKLKTLLACILFGAPLAAIVAYAWAVIVKAVM